MEEQDGKEKSNIRIRVELKVPLGGFRGGSLEEMENCYKESS